MKTTNPFVGLTATLLLLYVAIVASSDHCEVHFWHPVNQPERCSKGMREVYEDNMYGQRLLRCCKPNTKDEENVKNYGLKCRTTKCKKLSGDPCSSPGLTTRIYENQPLVYDEVSRTTCGTGKEIAYCCRRNSTEGLLATIYGAEQNEFPHMAKIPGCGSTIYNKRYILTAAHCVVDSTTRKVKSTKNMVVKVGQNVVSKNIPENNYPVEKIIVHKGYSKLAGNPELMHEPWPRTYNDIALLKLKRDIEFGEHVKSLEIAPSGFVENEYASNGVILGWGKTATNQGSDHLQKSNVFIRDDESCFGNDGNQPYSYVNEFQDQLLCVGGIMDGIISGKASSGDSGGPTMCRGEQGHPVLCGITSFSTGSSATKTQLCVDNWNEEYCHPNVYAEVDHFHDWIVENAGEQDESTFYEPWLYGVWASKTAKTHQVHITTAEGKSCGGTLITPTTVVTAAQCVSPGDGTGDNYSDVQVVSGLDDVTKPGKTGTIHEIKKIHIFPGFRQVESRLQERVDSVSLDELRTDPFYQNDLAVIKLKKGVKVTQSKLPRLPEVDEELDNHGIELAFQRDTRDFGYSNIGGKLTQREFHILDKDECQRRIDRMSRIGLETEIDENLLCGVEEYSGGSTCDRELGGGLICKGNDGKDTLCGVQVWRLCKWSVPNGFLDVRSHLDWIKKFI